jgi:hypothetical protein
MNAMLINEITKFGSLPADKSLIGKGFDFEGYTMAIKRAAIDLTPRTLSPKPDQSGDLVSELLLESDDESFLNKIAAYFKDDPQEKFDSWHDALCKNVLEVIQKHYTNKDGSEVCYGKAQKLVNMTLKGCYCLKGALDEDKKEYFSPCHMALDSFTLAWYNRNASREERTQVAWSNLDEAEYKRIIGKMKKIEPDIELFEGLTLLQKEFLIWPLEIMINTVKEVNKCFGGLIEGDHVEEYFVNHNLKNDLDMANIILDRNAPESLSDDFVEVLKSIPKNQRGKVEAANFILEKYGIN